MGRGGGKAKVSNLNNGLLEFSFAPFSKAARSQISNEDIKGWDSKISSFTFGQEGGGKVGGVTTNVKF